MSRIAAAILLLLGACAPRSAPAPGPAAEPVPAPAPAPPPPTQGWTREAGLALTGERPAAVPFVATRLEVLEVSGDSFRVRCPVCAGAPVGWIARESLAWEPRAPALARAGDLAEFVAAVREAAVRRDWEGLRSVMSRTFVHSLSGPDGTLEAIGAWRGPRATDLARLPAVLDRGAALIPGTSVWAAPPEFASVRDYGDLRAGFVHGPEGWEWVFLVRSEL